ncbi:hypothetical protein PHO31112_05366 [Pandoraea horticolens]|uniref:DUF4232 domain-containing protein n=1 Tax=Pandoraea horticolens TaxID=2508298 RepID=A0A5E4ZDW4_9BURK|nr:DUF4232 domain-containing protein [Pandoraea horticolens]VVE58722.1 hypothetical protein PHO31112_05366 [Pandoraea horticolens]
MRYSHCRFFFALFGGCLNFAQISQAQEPPNAFSLASCTPGQIAMRIDDNGDGDRASHAGVHLTVKNTTSSPCALSRRPEIEFEDRQLNPLRTVRSLSRGMRLGPVLPPLVLAPGQSYVSNVQWISGDVSGKGRCITPTFLALRLAGEMSRVLFSWQLCGPENSPPRYSVTFFEPAKGN